MLNWNEKQDCAMIIKLLQNDNIILASSDTVLGLFAQLSEKSKQKLDIIKIRNSKPYIILLQSAQLLSDFIDQEIDVSMQHIIDRYWPGPLTIIFKAKSTLPVWMRSEQGTIAIRIPEHEGLQNILGELHAVFTTSANISDQPLPKSYEEINPVILDQVQAVCCDPCVMYDGPASTIIDVSSGAVKILRQGVIYIDSI